MSCCLAQLHHKICLNEITLPNEIKVVPNLARLFFRVFCAHEPANPLK